MHPNRVLEGIENQTVFQTAGRQGEAHHEALFNRWQQLRGMTELGLLLSLDPALRAALQAQQEALAEQLRAG